MTTDLDRPLPPAPRSPLDDTGAPRLGAYAGSLDHIDLVPMHGKGLTRAWNQVARAKRWQYVMVTSREVIACLPSSI